MVRLGEHDFTATKDAQRQDVRIALAEPHENHDDVLKLNDIAVLHLYHDVKFTGNNLWKMHQMQYKNPLTVFFSSTMNYKLCE